MSPYITRYLTIDEYKEWDALVLQSPHYSIFDTLLWLDTISVLKCNIKLLGVFKKDNLVGGVAINVIERFGIKIAKTPHMSNFNSCHYIPRETQYKGKNERYMENIVALISEKLQKEFDYVVITNHPDFKDIRGFKRKDWRQNILYSYRMCLGKIDFTLISSSQRGMIKKARKGLIVTEEISDVVPVYKIIENIYSKQNLKCPLTLDEITDIYRRINNNILILAAKEQKEERYKAVIIYVIDHRKKSVYNLLNAYTYESPDSGANSLLMWEGIELLRNRGFEFFDFGEASMPSKAFFKSEFSSDLIPYYQVSKSDLLFKFLWYFTKGKIVQI